MSVRCSPENPVHQRSRPWYRRAAVLLLFSNACYTYQAVPVAELRPDMEVRLQLTASGVDRIRQGDFRNAVNNFRTEGRLIRLGNDTVQVGIERIVYEANVRPVTTVTGLGVLRSEIQGAEVRLRDKRRTTITTVGIVLGLAVASVLAIKFGDGRSGGNIPGGGGGGTDNILVP